MLGARLRLCGRLASLRRCSGGSTAAVEEKAAAAESLKPGEALRADFPFAELGLPAPWDDPWLYAKGLPDPPATYTKVSVERSAEEWSFVERLVPPAVEPPLPEHSSYPTPSGWRPPASPPPDLPFYVRREQGGRTLPLKLHQRRDQLDPKTMEYDYVEMVVLYNVGGDVAAARDALKAFLEERLGHEVPVHLGELQGVLQAKGADRADLEAFLFHCGF